MCNQIAAQEPLSLGCQHPCLFVRNQVSSHLAG